MDFLSKSFVVSKKSRNFAVTYGKNGIFNRSVIDS